MAQYWLNSIFKKTETENQTLMSGSIKETKMKKYNRNQRIEKYFIRTTIFILLLYALFVFLVVGANFIYTDISAILSVMFSKSTLHSTILSLATSSVTTLLSILVAIPAGYALSRYNFIGKEFIDLIIDLPITLPPLVAGLSLLIFFSTPFGKWLEDIGIKLIFTVQGIVLAQFIVAASFAIITLKSTFDEVDQSLELVARTLGCSRLQAFWKVTLPSARYGITSAIILTWSRAVGEFIPVLLFCGAVEGKTDILPIAIFLHIEVGNLKEATALTLVFIMVCLGVLPLVKLLTMKNKNV